VDSVILFKESVDTGAFLDILTMAIRKHRVLLHAYALVGNQALLLLETPEANLSVFMQGVQTSFARYVRESRSRSGPVFHGRYHAKIVQAGPFLRQVAAWVHGFPARCNSVRRSSAQMLKFLATYPGSSFGCTQGAHNEGPADVSVVLKAYGKPVSKRGDRHATECLHLLGKGKETWQAQLHASPHAVGDQAFLNEAEVLHRSVKNKRATAGLLVHGRRKAGLPRTRVLTTVAAAFAVDRDEFFVQRHGSNLRPALSYLLYRYAGLTQQEIAIYLRLGSAAAVSLHIRRLLLARDNDPVLAMCMDRLETTISSMT
jgi:putative transposase